MKVFNFQMEHKKWAMTACLLGTLGFNLSHLIDAGDANAQTMDMASRDPAADAAMPAPTARAGTTPPGEKTVVASDKTPAAAKAPAKEEGKAATEYNVQNFKIDGQDFQAHVWAGDNGKMQIAYTSGSCATCSGLANTDENYHNAIQDMDNFGKKVAELVRAKVVKVKPAEKTIEDFEGLSDSEIAKLSDEDKDTYGDLLVARMSDHCDKDDAKDEASVKCYTNELAKLMKKKVLLKKGVLTEDKIDEVVNDKIKGPLKTALIESKFKPSVADLVDKLQRILPGKFASARQSIIEASGSAARTEVQKIKDAESAVTQAVQLTRRAKSVDELQSAQNEFSRATQNLAKLKNGLDSRVVDLLKAENRSGLDAAPDSETSHLDALFKTQLMKRFDELSQMDDAAAGGDRNGSIRVHPLRYKERIAPGANSMGSNLGSGNPGNNGTSSGFISGQTGNSATNANLMNRSGSFGSNNRISAPTLSGNGI